MAVVTALVTRDDLSLPADLDRQRQDAHVRLRARCKRSRVVIDADSDAPLRIDARVAVLADREVLGLKRPHPFALSGHHLAHARRAIADHTTPIGDAAFEQEGIELVEVTDLRHRHEVIAAEVSDLAFDAALLVAFARCAEAGVVLPVRSEGDEARGLLAA